MLVLLDTNILITGNTTDYPSAVRGAVRVYMPAESLRARQRK